MNELCLAELRQPETVKANSTCDTMTVRVEIAARIMAGISHIFNDKVEAAKWAVGAADALIRELNK